VNRPLQVLWVIKGLGPGGAERLLVSVAQASDPERVTYEAAYVLPWKNHLVDELAAAGVPSHLVGGRRGLADVRWLTRLQRLFPAFDVVCIHTPALASAVRPLVRVMKHRPKVVSVDHNLWSSYGRVTRLANQATVALDDQHVAVSDEVRSSMSERAQRATQVIVHGIPLAAVTARRREREAQRSQLGLTPDDVAVTTVANLRRTKDYPNLLRAAREVLASHPRVVFLAAGQGPLEDEIREEVARLGIADRFRLLGYVDNTVGLLSASDVFVLGSEVEGLSIALLEAMAIGLPVAATAVGGTPGVVTDSVEGRLVPARDPSALARAIGEILDDESARARMGAAAIERAAEFDISSAARAFEALYARLVA